MSLDINKKYLSIFTKRIVPPFFQERFPKFEKFIQYFFEYLEQDGNPYDKITNIIDFVDIDAVFDEPDQDLRDNILKNLFEQYLGTEDARYLSELVDEELFLKNQNTINSYKGTKYSFIFFFLLIMNGYIEISNLSSDLKKHNGIFRYNGVIDHRDTTESVQPYVYVVLSEFHENKYSRVIDALNPSGMRNVRFLQRDFEIDNETGAPDVTTVFNKNYYLKLSNSEGTIGYVKFYARDYVEDLTIDTDGSVTNYDLLLQNGRKLFNYDEINQTGTNAVFVRFAFNDNLVGTTDSFTQVDLVVLPDGSTGENNYSSFFYDSLITGDSEIETIKTIISDTGEETPITTNVEYRFLFL